MARPRKHMGAFANKKVRVSVHKQEQQAQIFACKQEHPDWTYRQLSEHLGINISTISELLRGSTETLAMQEIPAICQVMQAITAKRLAKERARKSEANSEKGVNQNG